MGKHVTLANRLKELRRALAWTQQDLSRASGLTRSYISRLEMGDIALPSSEKLRALAQALGTAPDDLLQAAGYIDSPSEASDLPDIKVYLRRKYGMQDPRTLQAIEIIVHGLQPTAISTNSKADESAHPPDATARASNRRTTSSNNRGRPRNSTSNAAGTLNHTSGEMQPARSVGAGAGRRGRKAQSSS
jgi:transcriptional regulator with XRE-family HTH domain